MKLLFGPSSSSSSCGSKLFRLFCRLLPGGLRVVRIEGRTAGSLKSFDGRRSGNATLFMISISLWAILNKYECFDSKTQFKNKISTIFYIEVYPQNTDIIFFLLVLVFFLVLVNGWWLFVWRDRLGYSECWGVVDTADLRVPWGEVSLMMDIFQDHLWHLRLRLVQCRLCRPGCRGVDIAGSFPPNFHIPEVMWVSGRFLVGKAYFQTKKGKRIAAN